MHRQRIQRKIHYIRGSLVAAVHSQSLEYILYSKLIHIFVSGLRRVFLLFTTSFCKSVPLIEAKGRRWQPPKTTLQNTCSKSFVQRPLKGH